MSDFTVCHSNRVSKPLAVVLCISSNQRVEKVGFGQDNLLHVKGNLVSGDHGEAKERVCKVQSALCLEDLVPCNHFYRQVEVKPDLSFVRQLVQASYCEQMGCSLSTQSSSSNSN